MWVWPVGVKPTLTPERYDTVVDKPCTLNIENDEGTSGRLECEKVANAAGQSFALSMSWGSR